MAILSPDQNIELMNQAIGVLPDGMAQIAPEVHRKATRREYPSLLETAGMSAGITGAFMANGAVKSSLRNSSAGKSLAGWSKARVVGRGLKNLAAGSAAGALLTAPVDYYQSKLSAKYDNDEKFKASHFGALLVPATVSATLGTGAFSNTMTQIRNSGKQGTAKTVKNILSPTKNWAATKHEFRNIKRTFAGGGKAKIGQGILMGLMAGASLIDPAIYAGKKLFGKKEENNMEKKAALRPSVKHGTLADKIVGRIALGAIGVYGGEKLYERRKKQLRLSVKSVSPRHLSMQDLKLANSID